MKVLVMKGMIKLLGIIEMKNVYLKYIYIYFIHIYIDINIDIE